MSLRFKIFLSDFHGGGVVSRHHDIYNAMGKYARLKLNTDCACGCYEVVGIDAAAEREVMAYVCDRIGQPVFG